VEVAVAPWVAVLLEMLAAFVVDVPPTLEFPEDVVGPPDGVPAVFPDTVSVVPVPSLPPLQP